MGDGRVSCADIPVLAGFRIGVTADRRAEEQAELLRRRGANVVIAPVVCIRPFGADAPLRDATEALVACPPDVVIATTGIGIRSWFASAESWGVDAELRAALGRARIAARGPKAAAALVAVGLPRHETEPSERLDGLVHRLVTMGIAGRRIALQLFGENVTWAIDELRSAGADVVAVPIYQWSSADDLAPAQRMIDQVVAGDIDAVTFTSAAAVRTLAALADEAGAGTALRDAMSSTVLAACVGPVTGEMAQRVGFENRCAPERGRLGLLVRALSSDLHARHRHLVADGIELTMQGATVSSEQGTVVLAGLERSLFAALAARPGVVVSRATLRRRVWSNSGSDKAVDAGVSRLRTELKPVGLGVAAVPRRGWLLPVTETPCPVGASDATPPSSTM
jgi:uroporphyrinogen-III synthase